MSKEHPDSRMRRPGLLGRVMQLPFVKSWISELPSTTGLADSELDPVTVLAPPARARPVLTKPASVAAQYIWDAKRNAYGCELFDRSVENGEFSLPSDERLLFHSLSVVDAAQIHSGKYLFLNCTHEVFDADYLSLVNPRRAVLEIPVVPGDDPTTITRLTHRLKHLHGRGFRLAFDQHVLRAGYASWRPFASFIKLDARSPNLTELVRSLGQGSPKHPIRPIATKIENQCQFDTMALLGVRLFQGFWLDKPVALRAQNVQPRRLGVMQLVDLAEQGATADQLVAVVRADPVLIYTLLKYVRASGMAMTGKITSVSEALDALLPDQFLQWVRLLVPEAAPGQSQTTFERDAGVRARMLIKLMSMCGQALPESAERAFLVGALSVLPEAMREPLPQLLDAVSLADDITLALTERQGLMGSLLGLALACEARDNDEVARLATALHLQEGIVFNAYLSSLLERS